jgi:predicted lipoprotein with Yx(FWY)xxD motif
MTLAACGSTQPASPPAGSQPGGPVATRDVPEIGTVLVDDAGHTVYFTDTDGTGGIKCVADCTQLWHPVPAPDKIIGTNLGAVTRPDGTNQLTEHGRPLYTFTLDSQEKPVTGHNATDNFGGVSFTWHAVVVSAGEAPASTTDDGGYGPGAGGGY